MVISLSRDIVKEGPSLLILGTFRSEDEEDYEYEFSVLSTRTSKMSVSKPNAHVQYGKLILVLVLVIRSKGPYSVTKTGPVQDKVFSCMVNNSFCIKNCILTVFLVSGTRAAQMLVMACCIFVLGSY